VSLLTRPYVPLWAGVSGIVSRLIAFDQHISAGDHESDPLDDPCAVRVIVSQGRESGSAPTPVTSCHEARVPSDLYPPDPHVCGCVLI
jgi:hypothetical protein